MEITTSIEDIANKIGAIFENNVSSPKSTEEENPPNFTIKDPGLSCNKNLCERYETIN